MSDNTSLNPGVAGDVIRDIDKGAGVKTQVVVVDLGGSGAESLLTAGNPMPVTGPLTNTQLRATPVPVTGGLTDTQLRAAAVDTLSKDFAGRQPFNTLFGESTVGWHTDDISVMFQYNVSTKDTVTTLTGSGAVTASNEQAVVSITGAAGTSTLASRDPMRYRPGHEAISQFTSVYNGAQAGVKQYHGVLNAADGACFGTSEGVFGSWFVEGGVETFTPQSSWNGDKLDGTGPSGFTIDITMVNIYMIQFGWLGIAPVIYAVYTGHVTGWRVCHVIDRVNTSATPHLNNPSLPISAKVARAAGTGTAADIRTSSWRSGVTGGGDSETAADRWFANTVIDVSITAGVRNNIFALRNEATFQGKTNHVVLEVAIVTFDNAGNKAVAFYATKGPTGTVTSGGVTSVVDAVNSVTTLVTGGTVVGGVQGAATVIKAGGERRTDVRGTGIKVYPGETLAIEAVAATFVGTLSLSVRWVEYF